MIRQTLTQDQIHQGHLVLVNGRHPWKNLHAKALLPVQERNPSVLLHRNAATLLSSLMNELQGWDSIVPVSGWRSQMEQQKIWDQTLLEKGKDFTQQFVARPNHSEHQTGLAIDLALKGESLDFICPDFPYEGICQQFRERAPHYGFIQRYTAEKEAITGIAREPWHFRYVGVPHAQIMEQHQFSLEEYIDFLRAFPFNEDPYLFQLEGLTAIISYLPAMKASTVVELPASLPYSISGNNIDGFILTQWRRSYE